MKTWLTTETEWNECVCKSNTCTRLMEYVTPSIYVTHCPLVDTCCTYSAKTLAQLYFSISFLKWWFSPYVISTLISPAIHLQLQEWPFIMLDSMILPEWQYNGSRSDQWVAGLTLPLDSCRMGGVNPALWSRIQCNTSGCGWGGDVWNSLDLKPNVFLKSHYEIGCLVSLLSFSKMTLSLARDVMKWKSMENANLHGHGCQDRWDLLVFSFIMFTCPT